METNYELKHKCLLVPLKAVLLVLAMTLIGFTANAQVGKSVRVANDQQLKEAMENPSVGTVLLEPGYYPYLNINAGQSTRVKKEIGDNGSRADCQYYIFDDNVCIATAEILTDPEFDNTPNPPLFPDPIPPGAYYEGTAIAGTNDPSLCNCCPPVPNLGTWQWIKADSYYVAPDTLYFGKPLNMQDMPFYVTGPGVYSLKYSWPNPYNSFVQTEYVFRGPHEVDLTAAEVCGTSTDVDFTLIGLDVFDFTVVWELENLNTNTVYPYSGPSESGEFLLDVTSYGGCGYYKLTVKINTHYSDPAEEEDCWYEKSIYINFYCEP
ncbi:MAG TPA: hypothetical protein PLW31_02295, partial [Bacteroidales bacterium]|nr:hypothetical protein [Bacteroidales bacterium]